MSTLVLGSNSYDIVPDVLGDPLTVSVGNVIPSLTGGAGAPSTAPTYGAGSLYIDTTNYAIYVYASAAWRTIASAAASVTAIAGTANQITVSGSTGSVTVAMAANAIMPGTSAQRRQPMACFATILMKMCSRDTPPHTILPHLP